MILHKFYVTLMKYTSHEWFYRQCCFWPHLMASTKQMSKILPLGACLLFCLRHNRAKFEMKNYFAEVAWCTRPCCKSFRRDEGIKSNQVKIIYPFHTNHPAPFSLQAWLAALENQVWVLTTFFLKEYPLIEVKRCLMASLYHQVEGQLITEEGKVKPIRSFSWNEINSLYLQ